MLMVASGIYFYKIYTFIRKQLVAEKIRILYVDDEPGLLGIAKLYLEKKGAFTVDILSSAIEALERLNTQQYDAIISDYQMAGMDGITFLK